jgi:hypothetical protein
LIKQRADERKIEKFLPDNREVLAMAVWMFPTGHMSWIYPREQIRPPSGPAGGSIPDYIMAGANSDGMQWFVLEFKGAETSSF